VAAKTASVNLFAQVQKTMRSALPVKCLSVESSAETIDAEVDSHLLELALLEMVQNSRDAVSDHERLRVAVKLESEHNKTGDWVRITYQDNGPGVPSDLKERIFEDFFSRRPGQKSGTGLGLGFVRRVVEAHGGYIIENGIPGQGAKFLIGFPRKSSPAQIKENGYVPHIDN
jgi:two-component system NtrC family sensor kinase